MAKQQAPIFDNTFKAAADLSTKQFFTVKLTAKDTVNLCAATSDICIGILQDKPKLNQGGAVRILGTSLAVVDGTTPIVAGDRLGPDANGRLVKKTVAGNSTFAIANDSSSAVGDIIEVLIVGPGAFTALT